MITFPGPASAIVTAPVAPDGAGVARVLELERRVLEELAAVRITIPAFNRLLIEGDPEHWDPEGIAARLGALLDDTLAGPAPTTTGARVELPACYDAELAPDLVAVAESKQIATADVAALHAETTYTVLATGFAPGFAYLGDLDPRLEVPRHRTPRRTVPVGGIGIADRRTGVYPSAGPGGWRIIGRVPPARFADPTERIARFEPGARVRFRPVDRRDYEAEA